ncbi:hypothetical protein H1C71_013133, partial [Ictidomys tridecemlineatus]
EGLRGDPRPPFPPSGGPLRRPRRGRRNVVGWGTTGRAETGISKRHRQGPTAPLQFSRLPDSARHSLFRALSIPDSPGTSSLGHPRGSDAFSESLLLPLLGGLYAHVLPPSGRSRSGACALKITLSILLPKG